LPPVPGRGRSIAVRPRPRLPPAITGLDRGFHCPYPASTKVVAVGQFFAKIKSHCPAITQCWNFACVQFQFAFDDLRDIFTQCLDVDGLVLNWVSTLPPAPKIVGQICTVFILRHPATSCRNLVAWCHHCLTDCSTCSLFRGSSYIFPQTWYLSTTTRVKFVGLKFSTFVILSFLATSRTLATRRQTCPRDYIHTQICRDRRYHPRLRAR